MRLTLWCVAIFLAAELIFGTGMWLVLRVKLFDIADTALEGQAADLEQFLQSRKDLPALQLQAEIGERYKIDRSQDCLQITDANGSSIYRSAFLAEHPLPPVSLEHLDRPLYQNRKLGGERFRFINEQVEVSGRVLVVRIGRAMRKESQALDDFRRYLLWFTGLLLLVASVGYRLSGRSGKA